MRTRLLLATALVGLAASHANAAVLLNEIAFDPGSTDAPNEYIELRNTGTTPATLPAGTYLVGIEGDNTGNPAGDVQTLFDLSGLSIPASGYLVLLQGSSSFALQVSPSATKVIGAGTGWTGVAGYASDSGSDIENSSVSFLLIQSATKPLLTDDIDTDNDGLPDGTVFAGWTVLDSVAVMDSDPTDRTYAAVTFARIGGITGTNITVIPWQAGYVARAGNAAGSTAADWIVAEMLPATAPATGYILSNLTSGTPAVPRTLPANLAGLPLDNVGSANFLDDAPTITAPGVQTIAEDSTITFAAPNTAITVADPDALTGLLKLTLTASSGTLTVAAPAGLTITSGANGTSALTATGTLAAINASLDGLIYALGANATADQLVTISVDDQGNTGVGGPLAATAMIPVNVTATNDAPLVSVPTMQQVMLSTALPFSTAAGNAISIADPDAGTASITATFAVTAGTLASTASGTATVGGSPGASLMISGNLTDVNATLQSLVFHSPATAQAVTLTVSVNDNGNSGAGGAQLGTGSVMISVADAAAFSAPAGPLAFTTALGGTSPAQMVMVMATSLTGMITVTAPTGFQVSTASAGTYASTLMLPAAGGTFFVHYVPTTGTTTTGAITYTTPGFATPGTTMLAGTVFRITTSSLPSAITGTPYSAMVEAAGGVAPVTFSISNAPAWLTISASGALSGVPDVASDPSIMITATDSQTPPQTTSVVLSLTVNAHPADDAGVDSMAADAPGVDAMRPDAGGGTPTDENDDGGGCCNTSHPAGSALLAGLVLGTLLVGGARRRRTR